MIVRSTLIYGPAVLLPRLVAFGLAIALTHAMPAGEYGLYALVIVLGEALDMSGSNWVRLALLRLDAANQTSLRTGLRRSLTLGAITTALGVGAGVVISTAVAAEELLRFSTALAAYVIGNSLLRIGLCAFQLQRRTILFSSFEVVRALAQLAAAIALVAAGVREFWPITMALAAVTAVAGAAAVGLAWLSASSSTTDSPTLLDRARYGVPIVALTITTYTIASFDRSLLKVFAGAEALGLYAAAYTLGRQPIEIVVNAVNQGAFPELMRRFDEGGAADAQAFLQRTTGVILVLLVGAFAAIWGLSDAIAQALMPQDYWAGVSTLAPMIALAGVAHSMKIAVFDNVFHLYKRNWLQLSTFAPCAVVMVVACAALIPAYGASGAAAATVLGGGAGLIGSALLSRRLLKFRITAPMLGRAVLCGVAGFLGCEAGLSISTGLAPLGRLVVGGTMGGVCWLAALAACNHSTVSTTWTRWISARRKPTEVGA